MAADRSRVLEAARNVFALLFLYGNVALIVFGTGLVVPTPRFLLVAFNVFGVFTLHEEINREILVELRLAGTDEWIVHDASEYAPTIVWKRLERFQAHRDVHGPEAREAQRVLAEKIKARYNRLHPERPADRIRVSLQTWPRDARGYTVRREQDVRTELLYAD